MEFKRTLGNLLDAHPRTVLGIACAIALALGLWKANSHPVNMELGQTDNFWPIANNLLDGKGYSLCYPFYFPFCPGSEATPTAMREPVPVLLFAAAAAVSGRSLLFTMDIQVLLFVGTVLLTFVFVRGIAGKRAAALAALAWAAYLPVSGLLNQLSADVTGTFFLLASACVLLKAQERNSIGWWALAGASLGIAALSRSALLLMALPWCYAAFRAAGGFAKWRRAWPPALVLGGSMLLVMSPWALRNKQVFGKAWLGTSMNGYNVWRMNAQVGTDEPLHYVSSFEADTLSKALLARRTDLLGTEDEAGMDKVYGEEAIAAIKGDPVHYLRLCGYRAVQLFTNLGVKQTYGAALTMVDYASLIQQLLYVGLGAIGLWSLRRRASIWILAIALQVAGYSAMVAQMRYIIPVMPFFLAFAAYALSRMVWREQAA
jgi:4-amino-4-deoxy-L-arabinose transferase-like glycosyltransferase